MSIRKSKYTKDNVGNEFVFEIRKVLKLDSDNQLFYLIADASDNKFLIPLKSYQHYGFKVGDSINCKLDRINCDGEIFFEPLNPFYKEGSSYTFPVVTAKTIQNYFGFDEDILIVRDVLGVEQWIRNAKNIYYANNTIKAKVLFIKKGRLFLQADYNKNKDSVPNFGKYTIIDEIETERFKSTYVLTDEPGNYHFLPMKPYKAYVYKIGMKLWAQIVKPSSKGFLYLEPRHPYYQIGASYDFKIVETKQGTTKDCVFVEDIYGHEIELACKNKTTTLKNTLKCKVTDIQKGRPLLEIQKKPDIN
jgi:hypothetical protein